VIHGARIEAGVRQRQLAAGECEGRRAVQVRLFALEVVLDEEVDALGGQLRWQIRRIDLLGRANANAALREATEVVLAADADGRDGADAGYDYL
jgi:hypothetical protein